MGLTEVYILKDSRTEEAKYVGKLIQRLQRSRLAIHIQETELRANGSVQPHKKRCSS